MKPREHNMLKVGERQRQARQWQWRKAKILFALSFVIEFISTSRPFHARYTSLIYKYRSSKD